MTKTRLIGPVVGVAAVLLLGGCAGSGFSVMDSERTAEDELPDFLVDSMELDDYDLDSSRLSGSHEGIDFYLVTSTEMDVPCLAVADAEYGSWIACGGGGEVETSVIGRFDVQLVREPAVEADGWTVISDNLRVRD
jgi:hypothetical protein